MAKKKVETRAKQTSAKAAEKTARTVTKAVKEVKEKALPAATLGRTHAALRTWNLIFAGIYAVQAALIAVLGKGTAVPVTVQYPALDTLATDANGHEIFAAASRTLFDIPIAYLLAAGLLVFALVHLLAATRYRLQFESVVDRGVGTSRWLAFGIGGALLMDAVYLLSGVTDMVKLILLAVSLLGACIAGLAVELLGPNRNGLSRLLKVAALVGGALPWLMLIGMTVGSYVFDGKVPPYLYGVYASTFILAFGIGLASWMRWQRRGRWGNTLYSEKMFMLLGLAAATVLVWQIFAGVLL